MKKRFCLSAVDKKFGGVCGGIAEYFGLEPSLVRIMYVLLVLLFRWIPIFLYFILWAVMPNPDRF